MLKRGKKCSGWVLASGIPLPASASLMGNQHLLPGMANVPSCPLLTAARVWQDLAFPPWEDVEVLQSITVPSPMAAQLGWGLRLCQGSGVNSTEGSGLPGPGLGDGERLMHAAPLGAVWDRTAPFATRPAPGSPTGHGQSPVQQHESSSPSESLLPTKPSRRHFSSLTHAPSCCRMCRALVPCLLLSPHPAPQQHSHPAHQHRDTPASAPHPTTPLYPPSPHTHSARTPNPCISFCYL